MKSSFIVIVVAALSGVAAPVHAGSTRHQSVVYSQDVVMAQGTQQAIAVINSARAICEAAGGELDPSRIRIKAESETESRYRRRDRDNTITIRIGGPRVPQDYDNQVRIEADASGACKPRK